MLLKPKIKPLNLMMDADLHVKVGDFGISKLLTSTQTVNAKVKKKIFLLMKKKTKRGKKKSNKKNSKKIIKIINKKGWSPAYASPEVLMGKPYGKSADVYSFAMVMYELFTMIEPYTDVNCSADILLARICMGKRFSSFITFFFFFFVCCGQD